MSKEELNVCLKCSYSSTRKKNGTYYKNISEEPLIVSPPCFYSAGSKNSLVLTSVSFNFWPMRNRESTSANGNNDGMWKTPQGVGYLELNWSQTGCLLATKIIRVDWSEILKMKPTQWYSLSLASNQLSHPALKPWQTQKGNTGRVLVENNISGITML